MNRLHRSGFSRVSNNFYYSVGLYFYLLMLHMVRFSLLNWAPGLLLLFHWLYMLFFFSTINYTLRCTKSCANSKIYCILMRKVITKTLRGTEVNMTIQIFPSTPSICSVVPTQAIHFVGWRTLDATGI